MRILLVNPPFNRFKKIKDVYFPIGLGYIGSSLLAAGFDVHIYNAEVPGAREDVARYKDLYTAAVRSHHYYLDAINNPNHYIWSEIGHVIDRINPKILGIGTMSAKFQSAIKIAEIYKRHYSKGIVILGGPHPTICPDEAINSPFVNFIVRKEGEKTIVELCKAIENKETDFSNIKGISYIKKGEIIHNEDREYIEDLDEIPFPAKNRLLYPRRYPLNAFGAMITQRGCPFRCAFCAAHCIWTRRMRKRSVDNVIKEIKFLIKKYGTREFAFWDDSFTVDKKRTQELCHKIIENKLNISWNCSTKVTILDESLITLMKKAGCSYVELGVETGSKRMLEIIKKDITFAQVEEITKILNKHNVAFGLMIMAGFPEEKMVDLEQTYQFIRDQKSGIIGFSIFTPYPGTELYDTAQRLQLLPEKIEWQNFSHQSPENAFTKFISKEDFKKVSEKIFKQVDSHNNSFWRKWEFGKAKIKFYLKNPRISIQTLTEELRKR